MSYRAELANAARWMNALADRLPTDRQPDLATEWAALVERLDSCRSNGARELEIIGWRQEMAARLSPSRRGGNA